MVEGEGEGGQVGEDPGNKLGEHLKAKKITSPLCGGFCRPSNAVNALKQDRSNLLLPWVIKQKQIPAMITVKGAPFLK